MDASNLGRLRQEIAGVGPQAVARALAGLVRELAIPRWQDIGHALAEIADDLPASVERPATPAEVPF